MPTPDHAPTDAQRMDRLEERDRTRARDLHQLAVTVEKHAGELGARVTALADHCERVDGRHREALLTVEQRLAHLETRLDNTLSATTMDLTDIETRLCRLADGAAELRTITGNLGVDLGATEAKIRDEVAWREQRNTTTSTALADLEARLEVLARDHEQLYQTLTRQLGDLRDELRRQATAAAG
jgi:hypothetical protein